MILLGVKLLVMLHLKLKICINSILNFHTSSTIFNCIVFVYSTFSLKVTNLFVLTKFKHRCVGEN